jgi:hypothetical protein
MKTILIVSALAATAILSFGCADTYLADSKTPPAGVRSSQSGGIDPITQAADDDTARRTQEDAQRMSDWVTQQNNQQMIDQANQMANQAAIDASNAAAAAATSANQ